MEGVIGRSKSEWEAAFIGTASSVTVEEAQEVTASADATRERERWKPRGQSKSGSQRLSSGEGDATSALALPSRFDASRKLLMELLGTAVKVDGDGLCCRLH